MEMTSKSKINGACEGFKKDRVFEFFNGAQWRQIVDKDKSHPSKNAEATIWTTTNGRHYLEIAGIGQTVEVQRLVK